MAEGPLDGVVDDEHPVFERPPPNGLLWRYLDLSKFVSILETNTIWFSRADLLGDPFEGSLSQANLRARPELYEGRIPEHALRQIEEHRRASIRHIYISCWHESDWESMAMWRLYMRDHGIALVGSYGRMRNALNPEPHHPDPQHIYVGRVRYVDYHNDFIDESNALSAFMHKRQSFEHEHEVRAVISAYPYRPEPAAEGGRLIDYSLPSPPGISVPATLTELVAEVRVAPEAPGWFVEVVEGVTRRYGLDVPVLQSDLAGDPVY